MSTHRRTTVPSERMSESNRASHLSSEPFSEAPTRTNSIGENVDEKQPSRPRDGKQDPTTPRHRRCHHCDTILYKDEEAFFNKQEGPARDRREVDIVTWTWPIDTSAENPHELPRWKKWSMTVGTSLITFTISFASSVFSTTTEVTAKEFGTSEEVMLLGVALYVVGFALGPLVWGPLSEFAGRKVPLFGGFLIFALFQIPVAVAQNLPTIFICRFFAGAFGAAPLAINSAMFADYWNPVDRGIATSIYSAMIFCGPTLGPVVGSFITESHLGWRWTAWITLVMAAVFGIPAYLLTSETYEPTLLKRKATNLRPATGNWALHSTSEEQGVELQTFATKYLTKPITMMFLEPILLSITLYMSLVYGILYLLFFAFPYSYTSLRGYSPTIRQLPFLAVLVGIVVACALLTVYTKAWYLPRLKQRQGEVHPEDRLPPMILGTFCMALGLFWFAWTASPDRVSSPWPQIVAGVPIGMGVIFIFMTGIAYIIDVYGIHGSSAVSGNTLVRSAIAGGFVMFATPMFRGLGVAWGMSLLGFCTLGLGVAPLLFWTYGEKVRSRSKWGRGKT